MSQATKKSQEDKVKAAEKAGEVAKKIWLAGLGAYGKAFDGATEQLDKMSGQYEKVSKETTSFFDELVAKGQKLDKENHAKFSDAKSKTSTNIEERIAKVKSSLSFGSAHEIAELNEKIDALTAKVDALLDAQSGESKKSSKKSAAA